MTFYNCTHADCDDGSASAAIVKKHTDNVVTIKTTYSHG